MAVIGVDFGTCFSSVAFWSGDRIMNLKPQEEKQNYRIPSVFYHDKKNTFVGSKAVKARIKKPQFAVESIKKRLEEPFFELDDRIYEPKEIVQKIFEYVLSGADMSLRNQFHISDDILELVITVPVRFSEPRKRMIHDIAENVQLPSACKVKVKRVIPEPVAAAIKYLGIIKEFGRSVLVYDLGGGTFDIALVQSTGNIEMPYIVIGQDGRGIGGNDWDEKLLEIIESKLKPMIVNYPDEKKEELLWENRDRLLMEARDIKEELSEIDEVTRDILLYKDYYEITVTRQEFDSVTEDLRKITIRTVSHLLKKHNQYSVKDIILVGGSSRMPQIINEMQKNFGNQYDIKLVDPEYAVSYGAAEYARILESVPMPVQLKATHTYGIGYRDCTGKKKIFNMIYENDNLPISVRRTSRVYEEGTRYSRFIVYESECKKGEEIVDLNRGNEILGVTVSRDTVAPIGAISVQELTLTEDNILKLRVIDQLMNEEITRELKITNIID